MKISVWDPCWIQINKDKLLVIKKRSGNRIRIHQKAWIRIWIRQIWSEHRKKNRIGPGCLLIHNTTSSPNRFIRTLTPALKDCLCGPRFSFYKKKTIFFQSTKSLGYLEALRPWLRIRITFPRIWIQLVTLMRIRIQLFTSMRIRIILLIKVMGTKWPIGHQGDPGPAILTITFEGYTRP
jgi:hypothetical protein